MMQDFTSAQTISSGTYVRLATIEIIWVGVSNKSEYADYFAHSPKCAATLSFNYKINIIQCLFLYLPTNLKQKLPAVSWAINPVFLVHAHNKT